MPSKHLASGNFQFLYLPFFIFLVKQALITSCDYKNTWLISESIPCQQDLGLPQQQLVLKQLPKLTPVNGAEICFARI